MSMVSGQGICQALKRERITEIDRANHLRNGMSGSDFPALLLANNKQRFHVDFFVHWEWTPFGSPPTQPFEIRIGCAQGHSNQSVDPFSVRHPLSYDESTCLGWIFLCYRCFQ